MLEKMWGGETATEVVGPRDEKKGQGAGGLDKKNCGSGGKRWCVSSGGSRSKRGGKGTTEKWGFLKHSQQMWGRGVRKVFGKSWAKGKN